jgi:hypothetical protein
VTEPAPLWRVQLDGGGTVEVYVHHAGRGRRNGLRLRVTVPHPDYLGPDVVAERVMTRERVRQLWVAVAARFPAAGTSSRVPGRKSSGRED